MSESACRDGTKRHTRSRHASGRISVTTTDVPVRFVTVIARPVAVKPGSVFKGLKEGDTIDLSPATGGAKHMITHVQAHESEDEDFDAFLKEKIREVEEFREQLKERYPPSGVQENADHAS